MVSTSRTHKNNDGENHEQQIAKSCFHSQLAANYSPETTALEWFAVQNVNVIERKRAESKQQHSRGNGADLYCPRNDKQDRDQNLDCDYRNRRRPLPTFVVELHRAQELGHSTGEFSENPKLGSRTEKKKRGQAEAAHVSENSEESFHSN